MPLFDYYVDDIAELEFTETILQRNEYAFIARSVVVNVAYRYGKNFLKELQLTLFRREEILERVEERDISVYVFDSLIAESYVEYVGKRRSADLDSEIGIVPIGGDKIGYLGYLYGIEHFVYEIENAVLFFEHFHNGRNAQVVNMLEHAGKRTVGFVFVFVGVIRYAVTEFFAVDVEVVQ